MSEPIRVGLIRCDTHGAYYAGLFAPHDPLRLQRPLDPGQTARYSWQTGGAHFYFYTDYADASRLTVESVDGIGILTSLRPSASMRMPSVSPVAEL